jgi:hypothetical protein
MSYISGQPGGATLIAAPTLAATQALLAYWQGKCGPAGIPRRDDIVPAEMLPYLPNLVIAEPVEDGRDWLYRLVGTEVVWLGGQDPTGKRNSEVLPPDVAARYNADYRRGADSRTPWFAQGNFAAPGQESMRFEAVGLPILARDGESVWVLLGVFAIE